MAAPRAHVLLPDLIVFWSITLNSVDVYDAAKESFINSSLWTYSQYRYFYRRSEPMFLNTRSWPS